MAKQLSITHHVCGKTSYNTHDIHKRYCGACHIFMAKGTYTITEPEVEATDGPSGGFWVNGIVAERDHLPYIQLSNMEGVVAQFTMSQTRQIAMDMLVMASRTEADAMIWKFFADVKLPEAAAAALITDFRDFRATLDADEAERTET